MRVTESAVEVAANARAWGIGSAQLEAEDHARHAFFRAYEVHEIHRLDDRVAIPAVPSGAAWYVSAVYVGRLYEVHFHSRNRAIDARVTAQALVGSGSVQAFARENQLEFHARTIGLAPQGDDALFASSDAEMREHYAARGPLQPILVQFSRVPESSRPQIAASGPLTVKLVSVEFPERNPARGTSWDPLGGRPEIIVRVRQSGRILLDVQGSRDTLHAEFDRVIGERLTVDGENPLILEFADRDMAAHDEAGDMVLAAIPSDEGSRFTRTSDGGVRVVFEISAP